MKILAIDIGGTSIKTAIATVAVDNQICLSEKKATSFNNTKPSFSITQAVDKYKLVDYQAVAVSATGVINKIGKVVATNGKIENYLNLDLKSLITCLTNCETVVVNDVTAIGYAEVTHLNPQGTHLVIALGTGIGGCLIYNNQILEGAAGAFAEIGQIKLGNETFEALASTKALVNLAQTKYQLEVLDGKQFFALLANNQQANLCFEEWIKYLALGIEQLLYAYNPHTITIAGAVSEQSDLIIPMLKQHLSHLASIYIENLKFRVAVSNNDAGLIGAVNKLRREVC